MNIERAEYEQLETIKAITTNTIKDIYPRYYPRGAVDFFLSYHSDENISNDIQAGIVYLYYNNEDNAAGTVTIKGNEICRLFVLPQFKKQGVGRQLLDFAENKISECYEMSILDASLPAKAIYLKRGYIEIETHSIQTESGDFLCYDVMRKSFGNHAGKKDYV